MIKRIKNYFKADTLQYEFLPPALEIEETPVSPVKRVLIWIILLITVSTFLWAYFGRVDEVAVARGKIIPDGHVKVVQPMEAGIIRAIHVKEGQVVKDGEVMIELDPTIKQADAQSTSKALSMHLEDRERLISELNGADAGKKFNGYQRQLKEAREREYRAREEALKLIVGQRQSGLEAARSILVKLEKNTAILNEQVTAYKELYKRDYVPKMELLEKQKELHAVENEFEAQKKIVKQSAESLQEAEKNLDALKREREKNILTDIVDRDKNISAIEGEAIKARKKFELEMLRSPVDGTVHGIASYTIGGVVTPAQPTVTVVPLGTHLVVEAMVQNQDIGFLKVGQDAEVKLDTFPFQKYGTIKGKVTWLSPDAFEDEKLGPIYKMKIELNEFSINVDGKMVQLSPGMSLSAEVKTNKRRIIEFFLSPIIKYAKESLTLR